jgi:poly(ADP-ribose) glycohydrolase
VQEELMFAIHPELQLSILMTSVMRDDEAIILVGAERVAEFQGYGFEANFKKEWEDPRVLDLHGRLSHQVVAIDARVYIYNRFQQYKTEELLRELNKAYTGFLGDHLERQDPGPFGLRPVVTGKWGCGMFQGDPQLKALIQWIAASAVGRKLVFACLNDLRLQQIQAVQNRYQGKPAKMLFDDLCAAFPAMQNAGFLFDILLERNSN